MCRVSYDAATIRRPSRDHSILLSPREVVGEGEEVEEGGGGASVPSGPMASTAIPSGPVMGSSREVARFQSPSVPLLDAVAKMEG